MSVTELARAVQALLPGPFEWCEIPGNPTFQLLDKYQGNLGIYVIQPFFMAKYPITFEQFQVFVDDPKGFGNNEWWLGLAASADHRKAPGNQKFTYTKNLPREFVSWWDSVAFCRWLTSRSGCDVRLPAEWEWQWAAQGPDDRRYPWGPEYIQGYSNLNESELPNGVYLQKTTPVDNYPHGASPYGVLDLIGNVCELCLNMHQQPENTSLGGDDWRVMRGGSFYSEPNDNDASVKYRGGPGSGPDPFARFDSRGFRIMCGPPPYQSGKPALRGVTDFFR